VLTVREIINTGLVSIQVQPFFFFIYLFMLIQSLLFSLAVLVVTSATALIPRTKGEANGSPGLMCYADAYNTLNNDWNKTYTSTEPQQIQLSLTDDAQYARIQFATLGQVDLSILKYWPSKAYSKRKAITVEGKVRM
jgi:hypothetical protein